jgi:hypothetical protein
MIAHRLYTEDTNRNAILQILAKHVQSYTMFTGVLGGWEGTTENSLVIELIGVSYNVVATIATAIKEANKQDAVLYTAHEIKTKLF